MSGDATFLGRGWSFPPEFNRAAKNAAMLENEKDIESSLDILLSTRLGGADHAARLRLQPR